ncbi:MAG TPA: hypothetical protein PLB25_06480 [Rhodoferax sp.]|nr:hypothetical protein [Rhodoferax sp.]
MFTLTSAAAQQTQPAADASNRRHLALWLAVKVDAKGGLLHGLGFDKPADADLMLILADVNIVINTDKLDMLDQPEQDCLDILAGELNVIFADGLLVKSISTGTSPTRGGGDRGGAGYACQAGGCH